MKPRLLFVDDEPNVLQGLRRMLRSTRKDWDMDFVTGGEAALQAMADTKVDVVVTDMRMPGMDGAKLLAATAERHPALIRMVLSGQCEEEATCRLIRTSHQFHSKPCDGDALTGSIRRAIALKARLRNQHCADLATAVQALPSPAPLVAALTSALAAAEPDLAAIGALISQDMALTVKLFQISNSAYFTVPEAVVDPAQALRLIGTERLGVLLADYGLASGVETADPQFDSLQTLWRASRVCSAVARGIATEAKLAAADVEQATVGALLHNVGALALAQNDMAVCAGEPEFGAYLCGLWGLPAPIVDMLAGQHEDDAAPTPAAGVVRIATRLVETAGQPNGHDPDPAIADGALEGFDLATRWPAWQTQTLELLTCQAAP